MAATGRSDDYVNLQVTEFRLVNSFLLEEELRLRLALNVVELEIAQRVSYQEPLS